VPTTHPHQKPRASVASAKDHERFLKDHRSDQALAQEQQHPLSDNGPELLIALTMKIAQRHLPEERVS
jgi:hypothetical protein